MPRGLSREDIRVTREWVHENCKHLTDRDRGLIELIHDKRLLRRDQIERLYPHFASTDVLQKRLNLLYNKHIIDRAYPTIGPGKGGAQQHICLDRAGAILLDLNKLNKVIGTNPYGGKSLPSGWAHRVLLNEYECQIRALCEEIGAELSIYQVEQPHIFNSTKLIPDIFCLIVYNRRGYLFFIEVDRDVETIPQVREKLDSYINYYLNRSWIKSEWASLFKTPVFPRVLVFTEDGRPKRQNALKEHSEKSAVRFLFGSHSEARGVLKGIMKG